MFVKIWKLRHKLAESVFPAKYQEWPLSNSVKHIEPGSVVISLFILFVEFDWYIIRPVYTCQAWSKMAHKLQSETWTHNRCQVVQ